MAPYGRRCLQVHFACQTVQDPASRSNGKTFMAMDKVLPREVDLHLKAEVEGGIVDMTISDNL